MITRNVTYHIRGFTLIELLMSVAIIAVLLSITMTWVDSARAKSRDSKVLREFQEVRTALNLYLDKYGRYPNEAPTISNPYKDNFSDMAEELVDNGFLAAVPVAPIGHEYHYYNYGPGPIGAIIVTNLETFPPSSGYSGSCRPWSSGEENWCTTDESIYYCLCNAY